MLKAELNSQVVLADGTIVNANSQEYPDLHRALKGGSNNFGIVTRFDVKVFRHDGRTWGGMMASRPYSKDASIQWFEEFANSSTPASDPGGMVMFSLRSGFLGSAIGGSLFTYSQPIKAPKISKGLWDNSLITTMAMTSYSSIARQNAALTPSGTRTLWATFSFVNSAAYMDEVMGMASDSGRDMPYISNGITLIFQPLWQMPRARAFAANGGNALGLEEEPRDLVIVLAVATWLGSGNDATARDGLQAFIEAAQKKASQMGVGSRYIYMNYAADFQDVIAGYGEAARRFLFQTAQRYDPTALFQRQVPGGFKLLPATAPRAVKVTTG
jgi:hypothetical protein